MPFRTAQRRGKHRGRNQGAVGSIDMPSTRITCNFTDLSGKDWGRLSEISEPDSSRSTHRETRNRAT